MFSKLLRIYKPAAFTAPLPEEKVRPAYRRMRWQMMLPVFSGCTFFYFVRASFSLAKPYLTRDYGLSRGDVGFIATGLAVAYGVSEFVMGNVSDRSNPRYFMATGLILSGLVNLAFPTFAGSAGVMFALWFVNGWAQGMGWPPSARTLTHWFSDRERGTIFAAWNLAHNLGGGLLGPIINGALALAGVLAGGHFALAVLRLRGGRHRGRVHRLLRLRLRRGHSRAGPGPHSGPPGLGRRVYTAALGLRDLLFTLCGHMENTSQGGQINMKRYLFPFFALLACAPAFAQQKTVHFSTSDGCRIEAFYLAPSSGAYVLVNAHGLGSSKNEWGGFQQALKKAGYGYLSLDLRGHNGSASCGGKKADYRKFTKEDWGRAYMDITAAAAFLKKKAVPAERLVFCGASVGANLALKAAAEGAAKPAALILLSPGIEYAGVRTDADITALGKVRVLVAASANDPYAWQSSGFLLQSANAEGIAADFVDGGGGHGVDMFKTKATIPAIIAWIGRK